MYFLAERIQRQCEELKKLIVTDRIPVEGIRMRHGEIPKNMPVPKVQDGFIPFENGGIWSGGGSEEYALFRFTVTIPLSMQDKPVSLAVRTNKTGWNALNPQMLCYVDGREHQGLDTNHFDVLLDGSAQADRRYDIDLYAFSGIYLADEGLTRENDVRLYVHLAASDERIEGLYYDLSVPLQYVDRLPQDSVGRHRMVESLNDAVNLIDFRKPYSNDFFASVQAARDCLQQEFYGKLMGKEAAATMVGHTHIDVGWLWRYKHTRDKTVRSFSTVLRLMEQYPEYIFMSSQPQIYEYVKQDYPAVFEQIRQRVREGRWEPEGAMWVESDTNVPSGESLVRQILFGKRFFLREFGVDSKILWLPDVFGYSAALPQILKKAGVDYFMTAKLWNNEINRFPYDTFLWRGIDGTEILTHLLTYAPIAYNSVIQKADIAAAWDNYKQKSINDDILLSFGYGDGGGGPTREMLESLRRLQNGLPGCPAVKMGSSLDYFRRLDKKVSGSRRLPKWVGELYYELHRGTYTTMGRNKRLNRMSEILYTGAEWLSGMANLLTGLPYPSDALNRGWKDILLNQFHDVLPGSSIKEVYQDTDEMYGLLGDTGRQILNGSLASVAGAVALDKPSLVVFNPLSWTRDGLILFRHSGKDLVLACGDASHPCQKVADHDDLWIAEAGAVPSMGYRAFHLMENTAAGTKTAAAIMTGNVLENRFFRLQLTADGCFDSIFDKIAGREVLPAGALGNELMAFEDKPRREDNWNLDIFYSEKRYPIDSPEFVKVVEEGPVRTVVRMRRQFVNSVIEQDIILYANIARVDFSTRVDWKERDIVLKAAFPVDVNTDRATYEVQYGHVQRNTHWNTSWDVAKFEVCGHKWADLGEHGYGVSLLNDCKYGYDIKDGCMRLTLLRSGATPNTDADREVHTFCYSLYPHSGGWQHAGTVRQAYDLNYPLLSKAMNVQTGKLPQALSLAEPDTDNAVIEVFKQAEDGDGFIVRLYEAFNQSCDVALRFYQALRSIEECDLMENPVKGVSVEYTDNTARFHLKALEIKTFRVKF